MFVLVPTLDESIYAWGCAVAPLKVMEIFVALLLVYRDYVHSGTETVATKRDLTKGQA